MIDACDSFCNVCSRADVEVDVCRQCYDAIGYVADLRERETVARICAWLRRDTCEPREVLQEHRGLADAIERGDWRTKADAPQPSPSSPPSKKDQ